MKTNLFAQDGLPLVSKVRAQGDLKESLRTAIEAIGGLGRVVQPGDRVLLKPNLNTADPPPASTDPALVAAAVGLLYEAGAAQVTLADSCVFRLKTRQVLEESGVGPAAEAAGARLLPLDEEEYVEVKVAGRYLRRIGLARAALEAEKLVYLCCLKTHRWAAFTMSLKLAVGFTRPGDRFKKLHLARLQEKIAELNTLVHPDLIIMDGRRAFISGGPAQGELREPGLILASGDRVALDVEGIKILQGFAGCSLDKDPWSYPQIRRAVALGLGASGEGAYRVVEDPTWRVGVGLPAREGQP